MVAISNSTSRTQETAPALDGASLGGGSARNETRQAVAGAVDRLVALEAQDSLLNTQQVHDVTLQQLRTGAVTTAQLYRDVDTHLPADNPANIPYRNAIADAIEEYRGVKASAPAPVIVENRGGQNIDRGSGVESFLGGLAKDAVRGAANGAIYEGMTSGKAGRGVGAGAVAAVGESVVNKGLDWLLGSQPHSGAPQQSAGPSYREPPVIIQEGGCFPQPGAPTMNDRVAQVFRGAVQGTARGAIYESMTSGKAGRGAAAGAVSGTADEVLTQGLDAIFKPRHQQ